MFKARHTLIGILVVAIILAGAAAPAAAQTIEAMVYYTQTSSAQPSTCNSVATYDVSNSSGTTQLVALASGQTIYICGYTIFAPTGAAAQLVYGTGTNCATGQTGLTPLYQVYPQTPIVDGRPYVHGLQAASSNALCLVATNYIGYSYYRAITISHTKVATVNSTTLSNFPVLVSGTYSYLATTSHGGLVTNASGYDIVFTSDVIGLNTLPYEVESYNASTGAVVFWVQVPSLSPSTDTVIYMWYGNSLVTTSQANASGVWDSNFLGVYHMPNGTTLSASDSTSNGNSGTLTNTPTATTGNGNTDGAGSFSHASTQYIALGSGMNPSAVTYSAWVNATTFASSYNAVVSRNATGNAAYSQILINSAGKIVIYVYTSGGNVDYDGSGSHVMSTGTWYYVAATYSSAAGLAGYVNGAQDGTSAANGALSTTAGPTRIASDAVTSSREWNGAIDEVRVSSTARSADWIVTEYNSENSPSTFYTIGAQQ